MTTNEAYEKYLIELQANGTTDNIQSTKGRFVVNYNKAQNRLVEWFIERKSNDDNRYIQKLKKLDVPLIKKVSEGNKDIFLLKDDYFDFINLNAFASKDRCKNQEFFVKEIKPENLNNLLLDFNTKPSFKYRESFYTINSDSITLFKDDFEFSEVLLSYYRYPQQVQLKNKENPESELIESDLEFDDKFVDRVISLAASLHSLNSNDPKFQALKQQALQKD